MTSDRTQTFLPNDNPIRLSEHDTLERAGVADSFARQVLALDRSEGAVVGVFGSWGSGKTSFINLARKTFDERGVPVLDFNPWMFSGAEQLIDRFFAELSVELKLNKLEEIGQAFEDYGEAVSGLSGPLGALAKITGVHLRRRKGGISSRRNDVAFALQKRNKPIIVVLDDVDRLSSNEIREVIKLVRLTASFCNVVYIVSCDRLCVERALDEPTQGLSGRDYLEKIIQWPFNVPEVPNQLLSRQLEDAIRDALSDIADLESLDEMDWLDIYPEVVRPLIRNIRDIRRYTLAIRETVSGLGDEVALPDVLALEAVRVFLPDVFRLLPGATDGLTSMSQSVDRRLDWIVENHENPVLEFNKWRKARVMDVITAAERHSEQHGTPTGREVTVVLIERLFPIGAALMRAGDDAEPYINFSENLEEYLRERRVAHEDVLRRYLERVVSQGLLTYFDAERALGHMADRVGLDDFMRSLEPARWLDVIRTLCDLASRFHPNYMEPGIIVLLNLWPDMPIGPRVRDAWHASEVMQRIAERLLSAAGETLFDETEMRRILCGLTTLSAKMEVVYRIGRQSDNVPKLVPEAVAAKLRVWLRDEIRSVTADYLAEEPKLANVLAFASDDDGRSETLVNLTDSPKLTVALLHSVRTVTTAGRINQRGRQHTESIDRKRLVRLYGSKEELMTQIESLRSHLDGLGPWMDGGLEPWLEKRGMSLDEARYLLELANDDVENPQPGPD